MIDTLTKYIERGKEAIGSLALYGISSPIILEKAEPLSQVFSQHPVSAGIAYTIVLGTMAILGRILYELCQEVAYKTKRNEEDERKMWKAFGKVVNETHYGEYVKGSLR